MSGNNNPGNVPPGNNPPIGNNANNGGNVPPGNNPNNGGNAGIPGNGIYMPTAPTMGGLRQVSSTDHVPWCGGPPNVGWTALETQPVIIHPTMLRPTSAGSSQKSQAYRTTGLENKFGHGGDLLDFQQEVMKHFERYGLDTITYVGDPADHSKMISIVAHHTKYTMASAKQAYQAYENQLDAYDKANTEDAKIFIENSLSKELAKELGQITKTIDNFIEYWMHLMDIVRIPTTDHFEKLKEKMRTRKIANYSGEDVIKMCQDYTDDYNQLHDAGLYDHNLTLTALKAIMMGGGATNEDFRLRLRQLRTKLDQKLLEIRYLSYAQAQAAMVADDLHLPGILRVCKTEYRRVLADNNWPAANHAKDSKALPKGMGM